jgi:hypothetical protein
VTVVRSWPYPWREELEEDGLPIGQFIVVFSRKLDYVEGLSAGEEGKSSKQGESHYWKANRVSGCPALEQCELRPNLFWVAPPAVTVTNGHSGYPRFG